MELCTNTGHMAWNHSEEYPKCAFFFGSVTPPLLNYVSILYKVDVGARGERKKKRASLCWNSHNQHTVTCVCALTTHTQKKPLLLWCHIYDNQSIIHLLALPLPCVDPTAMLPAHIWLRGAALKSWMGFAPGDGASGRAR